MSEHRISRRRTFPGSAYGLWEALTDPELLGAWLGADVEWELHPGATVRFDPDEGPVRDGRIAEVVPGERLAFDWWPRGATGAATRVVLRLDELEEADEAGGVTTTLTVTETGFGCPVEAVAHDLGWGMAMATGPRMLAAA